MHKAYTKLGHYQYSKKNLAKAIELYTLALDQGGDSDAANCLGLIYELPGEQFNDPAKAQSFYERAISLDNNLDALFNLGILLQSNANTTDEGLKYI
jgi:TPR repeat protein